MNGIDIQRYNYKEYLELFSVVFQDFKLFSFGLGENIAVSEQFDEGEVKEAMQKSGLEAFLEKQPKNLKTTLYRDFDKEGVEVSGGEAQKIALARAVCKGAPFVILDEPTAALDPMAEYEIYSRFNDLVADRTTVYISHRMSSCRFCGDRIAALHGWICAYDRRFDEIHSY
jgi:ATP-binding cassette subfamily B protein